MKRAAKGNAIYRTCTSITALVIGALAAGCGGGGADEGSAAPPTEAPVAGPTPAPAPVSGTPVPLPPSSAPVPVPEPATAPAPGPASDLETKIMALGDSMTAGGEASGSAYRSYRGYLDLQLEGSGYRVDFIGSQSHRPVDGGDPDHEGYAGRLIGPDNLSPPDIDTIYDRVVGNGFAPLLAPPVSPDVIILALGWNSANYRATDAANQYQNLVATIQSLQPRAKLILATLSPPEGKTEAQSDVLLQGYRELNARARSLAGASATDNLLLADLARGSFQTSDYVAADDIHWSREGAIRAASIIFQALVDGGVFSASR